MGNFRKKYRVSCRLISMGKSLQGYTWEKYPALKKNISLMKYIMLKKKILHRYMSGKKFLTPEVLEKILTQT